MNWEQPRDTATQFIPIFIKYNSSLLLIESFHNLFSDIINIKSP